MFKNSAETTTDKIKAVSSARDAVRRDILKVSVAAGVGICAIGTPICAAVQLLLAPIFAEGTNGKYYPLAALDSLTERPQKFTIVDDKKDAWTTLPQQKIGSVFLRKVGDTVQAFHSLCPHMGCAINVNVKTNPKTGIEESLFYCPCHTAFFDLDGKRLDTVAPRDMDLLEYRIENGWVCVKLEHFVFGIAEKRGM